MSFSRLPKFDCRSVAVTVRAIFLICATWGGAASGAAAPSTTETPPPATPREFFNAGTQKLREGKLREAEAFLESVLSSQTEGFQPQALYNLGHVRFGQGLEELKKGPASSSSTAHGQKVVTEAGQTIAEAENALASNDVQKMVEAYLHGRGTRRELNAATKAVRHAMETYGAALNRWERASGDFKSTFELNPRDTDARQNAEIVDRLIAKLVDSLRELEQAAMALAGKKTELGEKMKNLKGKIPEQNMPPGAEGDEEEEEEAPKGPKEGDKEGATKEGREMPLSPEQAAWLLESFKLDSERKLPMGQKETSEPKNRSGRTW